MDKQFLIITPGPSIHPLFVSLAHRLNQKNISAHTINEALVPNQVSQVEISDTVINQITRFEKDYYNPRHNKPFNKQLDNFALKCLTALEQQMQQHSYTDLVVWNGWNIINQTAIFLADKYGVKIWYLENGWLPNTLQLDLRGVNFNNSLSGQNADFYRQKHRQLRTTTKNLDTSPIVVASTGKSFWQTLRKYINHFGRFWPIVFWKNFILDNYNRILKRTLPLDTMDLPKNFILVLFQVEDDTQILTLSLSPYVKNMGDMARICYTAIKQVTPDTPIVFKEHPNDLGRHSHNHLRLKYPDVIWIRNRPLEQVLPLARIVITVNSGAGVEALGLHKPVITVGRAFYNVPGLVYHAQTKDDLPQLIQQALTNPPDTKLMDSFINYLRTQYLIPGGWKNFSEDTLDVLINRLQK